MIIDNKLLNRLSLKSLESSRKRTNYNFHRSDDDLLQRMLNVVQPGSYVQPHKHENPDKREAFVILKGRMLVVLFNDSGNIIEHHILDRNSDVYGIEISPGTYHTIVALEKDTCVYEVKDGPYNPDDDKHFADWAPSEEQTEEGQFYLKKLVDLA